MIARVIFAPGPMLGLASEAAVVATQVAEGSQITSGVVVPAAIVVGVIGVLSTMVWRMLGARIDRAERSIEQHSERLREIDRLTAEVRSLRAALDDMPDRICKTLTPPPPPR